MIRFLSFATLIQLFFCCLPGQIHAQGDYVQQWKTGLSGSKLTAYEGRITNSNSTLTVLDLCPGGRYSYYKEGSWSVPGQAGGASQNRITGVWDVVPYQGQIYLSYRTDQGEEGAFPLYLLNNGKVSVGGTAFSVQQGSAQCY